MLNNNSQQICDAIACDILMMKSLLIVAITGIFFNFILRILLLKMHIFPVFKGCLSKGGPRNIILLVGDDIGWNEVSWNNPSFLTPNMEVIGLKLGCSLFIYSNKLKLL